MPIKKFDLQERFIDFAVKIIKLSDLMPQNQTTHHIKNQILRSGTSPAPNYGEAQSAESRADFIPKMKIILKELRETFVWLTIINRTNLVPQQKLEPLIKETDELISIVYKSIETARKNKK